jgi:predicted dehydrogenase
MTAPIRFGLVGVDSPHAPSFTQLLGNGFDGVVPGGTVTHAWKGDAAPDFPLSIDRTDDFARQVDALGVVLCDTPEAVAEACDALLMVASDARTHPEYFQRVAPYGKPIYVDTRFAPSLSDAKAMLASAEEFGTLVLSGSPKRFTPEARRALAGGPFRRASLTGALPTQPGHPGFSWYGVHLVDLAVAALGPGALHEGASIDAGAAALSGLTGSGGVVPSGDAPPSDTFLSANIRWADGREAQLSGDTTWGPLTEAIFEGTAGAQALSIEAGPPMLAGLLKGIINSIRTGTPNMPAAEILDIVALIEALNQSLESEWSTLLGANTLSGSGQKADVDGR